MALPAILIGGVITAWLYRVVASLVGRVFLGLGIAFVTHQLSDAFLPNMLSYMLSGLSGMSADAAAWFGYFRIDVFLTIEVSSIVSALGIKMAVGGFAKR